MHMQPFVVAELKFQNDKQSRSHAEIPKQSRPTDAGYDITAVEDVRIPSMSMVKIRTGIRVACPPGWYFSIDGRSSLWASGVLCFRGIIDSTYNGELIVGLYNITPEPIELPAGSRIAQLIAHRQTDINFRVVEEFSPEYDGRGQNGFGSSGT